MKPCKSISWCLLLGLFACGNDSGSNYETEVSLPGSDIAAGYGSGSCFLPDEAQTENMDFPDHIIGNGTPQSCTAQAVADTVALGGKIAFACGDSMLTIVLDQPLRIFNDADSQVVIDGAGKIALSGGGSQRILYMNTCDQDLHWTTPHCDNQDHPRLTVQNLTFINGNSRNADTYEKGGGAIFARGGRLKIVNSRFYHNVAASTGADVGGGAIRVFDQYNDQPVYVVNSVFGGADSLGNSASNGGALSSIGVSWHIVNSTFSYNTATGNGGSGGAIYNDGNTMKLSVCGSRIEYNKVNAYGAAVFFVSNDHSGSIAITSSLLQGNTGGSWYPAVEGVSMHADTPIDTSGTTIIP